MQIKLPPELVAFVAVNSGEGTHFSSADEFIAAVLQEKCERLEMASQDANGLELGECSCSPNATDSRPSQSLTALQRTRFG